MLLGCCCCCCFLVLWCLGHDPNDYEIGKRVGLETINIMNKDGSLNANAGRGLDKVSPMADFTSLAICTAHVVDQIIQHCSGWQEECFMSTCHHMSAAVFTLLRVAPGGFPAGACFCDALACRCNANTHQLPPALSQYCWWCCCRHTPAGESGMTDTGSPIAPVPIRSYVM